MKLLVVKVVSFIEVLAIFLNSMVEETSLSFAGTRAECISSLFGEES